MTVINSVSETKKYLVFKGVLYKDYIVSSEGYIISPRGRVVKASKTKLKGSHLYVNIRIPGTNSYRSYPLGSLVWETFNGKHYAMTKFAFIDGDTCNCSLDNIKLILDEIDSVVEANEIVKEIEELTESHIDEEHDITHDTHVPSSEFIFANLQVRAIQISAKDDFKRKIRARAIKNIRESGLPLTDNSINESIMELIAIEQERLSLKDIPLLESEDLTDIYSEIGNVLPYFNSREFFEYASRYCDVLFNEGYIVGYNVLDNILHISLRGYDMIQLSVSYRKREPINSLIALIKLYKMITRKQADYISLPF